MRQVFLLLAGLLLAASAQANEMAQCRTSPKLTGPCFTVHGRFSIANGWLNHRIWPVGSHRVLAIVDSTGAYDENAVPLPQSLHKALSKPDTDVFGDYTVCPLTREKPGVMRHVCLVKAAHLTARKR